MHKIGRHRLFVFFSFPLVSHNLSTGSHISPSIKMAALSVLPLPGLGPVRILDLLCPQPCYLDNPVEIAAVRSVYLRACAQPAARPVAWNVCRFLWRPVTVLTVAFLFVQTQRIVAVTCAVRLHACILFLGHLLLRRYVVVGNAEIPFLLGPVWDVAIIAAR